MERNNRKVYTGTVVSTKMDKTITVLVETHVKHKKYGRRVKSSKKQTFPFIKIPPLIRFIVVADCDEGCQTLSSEESRWRICTLQKWKFSWKKHQISRFSRLFWEIKAVLSGRQESVINC